MQQNNSGCFFPEHSAMTLEVDPDYLQHEISSRLGQAPPTFGKQISRKSITFCLTMDTDRMTADLVV